MNTPTFYKSFFDLPLYNFKFFLHDKIHQYLVVDGTPTLEQSKDVLASFSKDCQVFDDACGVYLNHVFRYIEYNNFLLLDMLVGLRTIQLSYDATIAKRIVFYLGGDWDLESQYGQLQCNVELEGRRKALEIWKSHYRPFVLSDTPIFASHPKIDLDEESYFLKKYEALTFFLAQEAQVELPHETTTIGQIMDIVKKCTPVSNNHYFLIPSKLYGN